MNTLQTIGIILISITCIMATVLLFNANRIVLRVRKEIIKQIKNDHVKKLTETMLKMYEIVREGMQNMFGKKSDQQDTDIEHDYIYIDGIKDILQDCYSSNHPDIDNLLKKANENDIVKARGHFELELARMEGLAFNSVIFIETDLQDQKNEARD